MIAKILTGLVAVLHLYFMYLEMIAWDTPVGRKAFSLTPEFAAASKALAVNQGLYNGFLAAGLIWGIWLGDAGFAIKAFFLGCVIVAGMFGALTVSRKILFVQALPALLALLALISAEVSALGELQLDAAVPCAASSRVALVERLELAEAGRDQPVGRHAVGDQELHHRGRARRGELPVVAVAAGAGQRPVVGVAVDAQHPVDLRRDFLLQAR